MATLAAILAIGKPVAFDASALERETRGFISMTIDPAVARVDRELDVAAAGVDADRADDRRCAMSRSVWYSRSVSVIAGATVIESPVCTPIGSRFSIEQTITTLSARVAHHLELVLLPAEDRLLQEHLGGRAGAQAGAGDPAQVVLVVGHAGAGAAHREGRAGRPPGSRARRRPPRQSSIVWQIDASGRDLAAELLDDLLERLAVLAALIASMVAPISSTPYFSRTPASCERDRGVQRGLAAEGGQQRVGALLGDDLLDELRGDRLDVGGVGELRVGHDRRRVGVDQDRPAGPRPRSTRQAWVPE